MFKLIPPPSDAFNRQPFWNPGNFYDIIDHGVEELILPEPPPYKEEVLTEHGLQKFNKFELIRYLPKVSHRTRIARFECSEVLHQICWILGVPVPDMGGATYKEFIDRFNSHALSLLHEMVGQKPDGGTMPTWKKLFLYRGRRCFPSFRDDVSPLKFLKSYTTPIDCSALYGLPELHQLLSNGLKGRGFIVSRVQFRNIVKNTASMEYLRSEGGFNRSVHVMSLGPFPSGIGPIIKPLFYCPTGETIARFSHRNRDEYMRSFANSVHLMRSIGRKPLLFADTIFERSGKRRIPALAEGFCAILGQTISDIGKTIQARIFPLTKGGPIKMRHQPGTCYLSGDYKDSTNYIWWEAIIVAYYHYFRYCDFNKEQMGLYMEVVKFLCGAHVIYDSHDDRERYRKIFQFRTKVVHPRFGFNTHAYYNMYPESSTLICSPDATGSPYGTVTPDYSVPPSFDGILSGLSGFIVMGDSIISVRGLAMCYSLAAPALHLIGAIPHWKFRGLDFIITGDDNASAHRATKSIVVPGRRKPITIPVDPLESLQLLEAEKVKTGMVPHDSQKSARGPLGFLLAERLLQVVEGRTFLVESKNFPVRILFPDQHTDWHAVTMPEAALRNLKEVPDRACQLRIMGFIRWKYDTLYKRIQSMNITIGGENGLFPLLPSRPGCVNSFGKASRAQVFKLPSTVGSGWPLKYLFSILTQNVTIPVEVEGGYNLSTNTHASLNDLGDALRPFQAVSPYNPDHLNRSGYIAPLFPTLRDNLVSISYDRVKKPRGVGIAFSYSADDNPYYMESLYLTSILDLPKAELSHSDLDLLMKFRSGELPYGPGMPDGRGESMLAPDPPAFADECEEMEAMVWSAVADDITEAYNLPSNVPDPSAPYRTPINIWASNFSCGPPDGTCLKDLARLKHHWFIDMANSYPKLFRESDPVLSTMEYARYLGYPAVGEYLCAIYFVLERPGRTVYRMHQGISYVRLPPRRAGRAGADLEFRQVSTFIHGHNPDAAIYYTSRDSDWLTHSRLIGALRRAL